MSSFVDISELKQAEEQIKASLAEKEVMLKEIHHRVKNNLQVISSLLKLQTEHTRDAQVVESLKTSRDRIKSIALIHEKLYQSKDLARVDFAKYIKDLMYSLFRSYGVSSQDIKLRIDIGDVYLDIEQAIPCALIINELVTNCLEHAFPNASKGEIHLEFVSVPKGGFRLMVSDNGIGLPEGFDPVTAETLGLELVETLVAQLKGKIEFNSRDGATFNITFPMVAPSTQEVG
jgi:two-component sensor histidine kinase